MEVYARNGAVFEEKVSVPLGEPENPLPLFATKEELRNTTKGILTEISMGRIERLLDLSDFSKPATDVFMAMREGMQDEKQGLAKGGGCGL